MRWFVFLLCFVSQVWAAEVQLAWDPNSEPDLAGYRISYGTVSGIYTTTLDVGNTTSCTVHGLQDGIRFYFAATAYDLAQNESGYSNEVNWQSGEPAPHIGATALRASRHQGAQTMTTIGPIAISTNNDDGELYTVDGGGTLYSGEGNEIWMGDWGAGYPTYGFFRSTLPAAIPSGATINSGTILRIYGASGPSWDSGSDCLEVMGEQSPDAPQASGTAPPTLTATVIRWPASGGLTWLIGGSYNEVDIAPIIQELVDDYGGLASGAHIQIWVRGKSTNGEFHNVTGVDYNYGNPSYYSTLTIVYTAGGVTTSITIDLLARRPMHHMLVR